MPHLSDVALALQLHAEPRADGSDVTVIRKKASQNRWRAASSEEWRRGRCLGAGGYGQVYLEECISGEAVGHVRAVKKLYRARNENYYHELNALALFSLGKYRGSFVQCFGWYLTDEHIFLSMEYLPHGDLQQYLDKPLPEKEGQLIAIQMLEAIEYMHERNFTHRDIKPANILVAAVGPAWWIKVADFGISKRTEDGMTSLRTVMGTQNFAAPEVLLSDNQSAYTNAVDIWGVGMITLIILIGMPNMSFNSILKYALRPEEPFPYQMLITQKVSADGRSFVKTLLERDGKIRPSASECLQHHWLSQVGNISQGLDRLNGQGEGPSGQQSIPSALSFDKSAVSSDGLDDRAMPLMGEPMAVTSRSTDSLFPTAQWSTYKSDVGQSFETISGNAVYSNRSTAAKHKLPVYPDGADKYGSSKSQRHTARTRQSTTGKPDSPTLDDNPRLVQAQHQLSSNEEHCDGGVTMDSDVIAPAAPLVQHTSSEGDPHASTTETVAENTRSRTRAWSRASTIAEPQRTPPRKKKPLGSFWKNLTQKDKHLSRGSPVPAELRNPGESLKPSRLDRAGHPGPNNQPMTIRIKPITGQFFDVGARLSDSIQLVKRAIQDKEGIPADEQNLIFRGKVLEDSATVFDYNIEDRATVSLVLPFRSQPLEEMLFVKTPTDRMISININPLDTVYDLKKRFRDMAGLPQARVRLSYAGQQLEDERRLSHYSIQKGCTVLLDKL